VDAPRLHVEAKNDDAFFFDTTKHTPENEVRTVAILVYKVPELVLHVQNSFPPLQHAIFAVLRKIPSLRGTSTYYKLFVLVQVQQYSTSSPSTLERVELVLVLYKSLATPPPCFSFFCTCVLFDDGENEASRARRTSSRR
jgi:hypothetical protein